MVRWILFFMVMLSSLLPVMTIDAAEPHKMPFPVGKDISDRFVGTVHRNDLIEADAVYQVPQTNVITFEPGSYSGWHAHGAMTVIGVAGQGIYQEWGKEPVELFPGDAVYISAGVKHWHGAAPDSWFSHLAIEAPGENKSNEWLEPVSEEEYNKI